MWRFLKANIKCLCFGYSASRVAGINVPIRLIGGWKTEAPEEYICRITQFGFAAKEIF